MSPAENKLTVSDLLPCPFCGGKAARCDCTTRGCGRVVCNACGIELVHKPGDFQATARAWNRRAVGEGS